MNIYRLPVFLLCLRSHSIAASIIFPSSSANHAPSSRNSTADGGSRDNYAEASACNAARISYSQSVQKWETPTLYRTSPVTTDCSSSLVTYTWTNLDTDASHTWITYCDGHPRTPADFTYPVTHGTSTVWETTCGKPMTNVGLYPGPSPSCTIAPTDCNRLWQTGIYMNATSVMTTAPMCSTAKDFRPTCGECTIFANGVQLIYWPVTTVFGDVCKGNGSTITAKPTGHGANTMVISGYTYTSGMAYMSFSDIWATVATNLAACGKSVENIVLPVFTFDLSSISTSGVSP